MQRDRESKTGRQTETDRQARRQRQEDRGQTDTNTQTDSYADTVRSIQTDTGKDGRAKTRTSIIIAAHYHGLIIHTAYRDNNQKSDEMGFYCVSNSHH